MKKIAFAFTLLLLAAAPVQAAVSVNPFVSAGIGLSINDGDVARIEFDDNIFNTDTTERTTEIREFQSDPGLNINIDYGVAFFDVVRLGILINDSMVFSKNFGLEVQVENPDYDPDADDDDTGNDDTEFVDGDVSESADFANSLSVALFTGLQFELGKGTATRHYLYFDYGFGFFRQDAILSNNNNLNLENYAVNALTHIVRAGVSVPNIYQNFGTGLELTWVLPQSGILDDDTNIARTFSITVKGSYLF